MIRITMRTRCLFLFCLMMCFAAGACRKKTPDKLNPGEWTPVTRDSMNKAGFAENPANLNVKLHNAGTKKLSDIRVSVGKEHAVTPALESSAEATHLFPMYQAYEPLNVSFKDEQGQVHEKSTRRICEIFPRVIHGNLDIAVYIDSNTAEVIFLCEDE